MRTLEDFDPRQKAHKWEFDFRRLQFLPNGAGMLGQGNFSVVRLGRLDGTPVAVKFLKVRDAAAALESFHQEVGLMSGIRHPNVLW